MIRVIIKKNCPMIKLQFCGAARTVTGSCHYLDTGNLKILIDCGAFQGSDELEDMNRAPFPFDPAEIDYVILTHAHYDHVGRLPLLVKQGFKGRILSTQPSRDLADIILQDAAKLQEEEYTRWMAVHKSSGEKGGGANVNKPLFDLDDVMRTIERFDVYPYGNSINLKEGVEFRMRDAGHILGSAMIELWVKNALGRIRKIVFSGDLGQPGQRIVRDPDLIREADYVLVESTYGNRIHKSKDETILEFLTVLKEAQKDHGNVIIPTFAIERAQEVIYELNLFYENKLIDSMPVYLDSPMALQATDVFKRYPTFYDEDARRLLEKGDDPFSFPDFKMISSVDDSKRLATRSGVVIMAGSGMCNGGRIIHHLDNNLSKKNTHVIFVGYQVKGTLGRAILDGEPQVNLKGHKVDVYAKVHTLGGFSAHADMRDLMYWLRAFGHSPRQVFIVHGEETVAEGFAANVREELRLNAHVPIHEEVVELD